MSIYRLWSILSSHWGLGTGDWGLGTGDWELVNPSEFTIPHP
ncbi:hypothetical protein [Nostoc sphaeroides]|nr:hypothetical protein [Nostoc sphaeroides]